MTWKSGTETSVAMSAPSSRRRLDDADRRLRVGQEVLVRRHRALREPGRAARVEDRREVVAAQVLGRRAARRRAAPRRARRRTTLPESSTTYCTSGSMKRVLTGTTTAPASWRAEEREHPVGAVAQPERDAVAALARRALAQAAGDARGAVPQLAVGQRAAADLDDRRMVRDRGRRSSRSIATSDAGTARVVGDRRRSSRSMPDASQRAGRIRPTSRPRSARRPCPS